MFVQLNKSGEFGLDGPAEGATGTAYKIVTDEFGQVWLGVYFEGHTGLFWVLLEHVLYPGESSFGGGTTWP